MRAKKPTEAALTWRAVVDSAEATNEDRVALADALIRANKKFDVFVFPNRNHGYAGEPYAIQLTMDYFVRHLRHEEPPADYVFRMPR